MRIWAENIGVAAGYFLLSLATATFLSAYGVFPAPFWPSASIGLAAALVGGRRLWPGIWVGSFLANWLLFHASPPLAAAISISNVIGPAIAAAVILRRTRTALPFFRVPHVAWFILSGALLHGFIVATGGVGLAVAFGTVPGSEGWAAWWRWALSDAGGTFLFGPALLLWWCDPRVSLTRPQWVEGAAGAGATLLLAWAVFFGIEGPTQPLVGLSYLLLVPLMWFTVRFSVRAGAALLSGIALLAIASTIAQLGPFHLPGIERPMLDVGLMVLSLGISTLAVGALVSERASAERQLRGLNETLEQRITERTRDLHRRATQDGLTGVANRGWFFEQGEQAIETARRTHAPLTALMVDLDGLKRINDTQGHGAGDAAIARVAEACRAAVREGDLIGRVGGDEFAVLLPKLDAVGARATALRIEQHLRDEFPGDFTAGASIGWAVLDDADAGLDALLARADAAMYANKRERYCVGAVAG